MAQAVVNGLPVTEGPAEREAMAELVAVGSAEGVAVPVAEPVADAAAVVLTMGVVEGCWEPVRATLPLLHSEAGLEPLAAEEAVPRLDGEPCGLMA